MQWVAIYSGITLSNAKLVAITTDEEIIRGVARKILEKIDELPTEDQVCQALDAGRKRTLETITETVER